MLKKMKYFLIAMLFCLPVSISADTMKEEKYSYIIKYYKDQISQENYLGEDKGTFPKDTIITEELIDLDKYLPEQYNKVYTDKLPYKIEKENNTILVVYTKETYPYKIEYYKDSFEPKNKFLESSESYQEIDTIITEELLEKTFGENYKISAIPDGYQFQEIKNLNKKITNQENIVQILYTKRNDLSYKIEYYYDGILEETKEYYNQTYQEKITKFDLGEKEGYERIWIKNNPLIISQDLEKNTIKIYYESEEQIAKEEERIKKGLFIFFIIYRTTMNLLTR